MDNTIGFAEINNNITEIFNRLSDLEDRISSLEFENKHLHKIIDSLKEDIKDLERYRNNYNP